MKDSNDLTRFYKILEKLILKFSSLLCLLDLF